MIPPVPPRLSPWQSQEPTPTSVVDMDLAKPSTAAANVARDRRSVHDILQGGNNVATASSLYNESIRTEEDIVSLEHRAKELTRN